FRSCRPEQRDLLHHRDDPALEAAHAYGEVKDQGDHEEQPEEVERAGLGARADEVANAAQQPFPGGKQQQHDAGEHPQHRVLLLQLAPAHGLEDEQQQPDASDDADYAQVPADHRVTFARGRMSVTRIESSILYTYYGVL